MRVAPSPGDAAVAPPFVGGGFEFAGVDRAGDKRPFPIAASGLDLITCPGMPAVWAGKGETLHKVLRVHHILCVLAMDFRIFLQLKCRDGLPLLRGGVTDLNVLRPFGAKVQLQRNARKLQAARL